MILKASLLLAFAAFLISFGISFQALGIDQGLEIHERAMEQHRIENRENSLTFSSDGPRTYEYFSYRIEPLHSFSCCLFSLKLAETISIYKHVSVEVTSRIISFGSLLLVLNKLRIIFIDNSYVDQFQWDALQNSIAKSWRNYPWILGFIALALICLQLVTIVQRLIQETKP